MQPGSAYRHDASGGRARVVRGPLERLIAWLYTGPLGHLDSALADLAAAWGRYLLARVKRRRGA